PGPTSSGLGPAIADVRAQVADLIGPGFVTATGAARLPDLVRYLQAARRRLDKLPREPDRDRTLMHQVAFVTQTYRELCEQVGERADDNPELIRIRWMIEELRVSYFAQELRTPYPVSDKRIYRAMDEIVP
ncbi:MAG: DUF3418 domain-containing protein, partial [Pseudonocardiaceae bacterium]